MDKGIKRGSISGAIIPALMHRIPSEHRKRGESPGQEGPVSSRRVWERPGRGMDKGIKRGSISGAIIPALIHRIPSELRYGKSSCLGESSTRMGDPMGSPSVAPLFGAEIVRFWLPAGVRSCFFTSCWLVGHSFSSSYRFFCARGGTGGQPGPSGARVGPEGLGAVREANG
ncbi:hypothetical protein L6452_36065 [Arctium lappa]|uniref:Uncharacterized protein n=1 Tax=Arctium lappa TaxID=4217 RepID=A0ACB8Y7J6_ARCLA|nr:hypothetical protein L6452_36065 [Arctium lappa]